jgi:hypothetical protein
VDTASKELNWEDTAGITLGNYVNINLSGREITGDFTDYVTQVEPMYMHEYGHYIDSQRFGPTYLFAIGLPSLFSAAGSERIDTPPFSTHDLFWAEKRANRNAKKYFGKYHDVDWSSSYREWQDNNGTFHPGTVEDYYPIK